MVIKNGYQMFPEYERQLNETISRENIDKEEWKTQTSHFLT